MPVLSQNCSYHPKRPGIAVCVSCRRVICAECTTQFDGIHRCTSCLEYFLVAFSAPLSSRNEWGMASTLGAGLALASIFGAAILVAYFLSNFLAYSS
jgi:hypothetical protein